MRSGESRAMPIDKTNWSGEGTFTQMLLDWLESRADIAHVRVEDAPSTRSDADYNFISNELFVAFAVDRVEEKVRRFGILPATRHVERKRMDLAALEAALAAAEGFGAPDYSDEGMLQFLRTERIIPPYQTRGYKLVELVRVYEAGTASRSGNEGGGSSRH
jgi:hypothetical protein